jgi:hypothetical protein
MKQSDAVYNAVTGVFEDAGVQFEAGMNASTLLTQEMRDNVTAIVTEGFTSDSISFEKTPANAEKLSSSSKLSAYVSGLISNWLRKDKRLNGGVAYVAKNPGSRVGSTDPQLKTLRALHKQFKDVDGTKAAAIQTTINNRVATLRAERASEEQIDISSLPADLIASLGL